MTRSCTWCGNEFTPRRSDAQHCSRCRATEPWRRAHPHEVADQLDGPAVVEWLESRIPGFRRSLNGSARSVQRWAARETMPSIWTVDEVATAIGLTGLDLAEIPADVWVKSKHRPKAPEHRCKECGEHMYEATVEGVCGFCIEEIEEHELAVAA